MLFVIEQVSFRKNVAKVKMEENIYIKSRQAAACRDFRVERKVPGGLSFGLAGGTR
jgi:hypothetical protein